MCIDGGWGCDFSFGKLFIIISGFGAHGLKDVGYLRQVAFAVGGDMQMKQPFIDSLTAPPSHQCTRFVNPELTFAPAVTRNQ